MAKDFKNKIKRLELENFTCFGKVAMDFSPGINVFIGENGTGKTHLLKVLYALSLEKKHEPLPVSNGNKNYMLNAAYNFIEIFKPDGNDLFRLVKHDEGIGCFTKITFGDDHQFIFKITKLNGKVGSGSDAVYKIPIKQCLYVPSLEFLSWFQGFIASYENRESSIDASYYYLAKALALKPLKGQGKEDAINLSQELANSIKLQSIKQNGDQFFIRLENSPYEVEAPMIATGINKLAQLIYLIMNGSLTKDTILFWDEPEANLNPKYILIVAKFLQTLANAGCQIFVATHDYLLPYELSLSKEYADVAEGKVPDMKFFALYKGENGTEVEEGETMPDLKHDAIMEGAGRHNDREDILFRKSLNREK
ncbi:MAG: AAA family ATPase [Saprospiraceae bacterium]